VHSEWLSDRMEGREVDVERQQAAKRTAAAAKGRATRAANKAGGWATGEVGPAADGSRVGEADRL